MNINAFLNYTNYVLYMLQNFAYALQQIRQLLWLVWFFFLPWDIISGAQTATVLFSQALRTQWYLNLSRFVQFCISAICSQGFRRFARSNSASFEGHDDIVSIVDKDNKHCSSAYIGLCCVVYSINIVIKRNFLSSL